MNEVLRGDTLSGGDEGKAKKKATPTQVFTAAAVIALAAAALMLAPLSGKGGRALCEAPRNRVVVELGGASKFKTMSASGFGNLDNLTRQPYKYTRERWGDHFLYEISGLEEGPYDLEISCIEVFYKDPGQRVFDILVNGITLVDDLDLVAEAGKEMAWQVTLTGVEAPAGLMTLEFRAESGEATVSNIRLIEDGATRLELAASESRHWYAFPLRFHADSRRDVHEVVLGRWGSRYHLNPVPQLLGFRQSPLGTLSEDLEELALAFRDAHGNIRALPFTDRYPLFADIKQHDGMTGVTYECEDPQLPFRVKLSFRAPFYPGDEKVSTAPFFYLDLEVENNGDESVTGEFLLLRPHREADIGPEAPQPLEAPLHGYRFDTLYSFGDGSAVLPGQTGTFRAEEALAVNDAADVTWHYEDITETSWIWPSPAGFPLPYPYAVYAFRPRGYSGLEWGFHLDAGAKASRTMVLASYVDDPVLKVRSDFSYRFIYTDPAGPAFASVDGVADYALGPAEADIRSKADFFDSLFGPPFLDGFSEEFRSLAAGSLQSFIINAWWCVNPAGIRWYSIWEGNCHFHSTIDVEYNNVFFYLYFWPDLLRFSLDAWTRFEKSNAQGRYLSHDIGRYNHVYGQAYPHDMPVEENADWLLMAHAYWKHTGDATLLEGRYSNAREYALFILACDSDGDGLPDLNTANTIDQGSPAVQYSRNQTYLGIKSLAALRAAEEMALAQPEPDEELADACRRRIILINHTLQEKSWLGDHFRVCDDSSVSRDEAEAYSLYATNGILLLMSSGLDSAVDQINLERLRADLAAAHQRNGRLYGDVHTSHNNENQWVSQNLWRDAAGFWLGMSQWPEAQAGRDERYWNLQKYFATKLNGSFWDAVDYFGNYRFNGASAACSLGLGSESEAVSYLESGNLPAGGARGACLPYGQVYGQSLGYYPRGASCFSLVSAAAGMRFDKAAGRVFYQGKPGYDSVPVFACADWENPDPALRVPLLRFDGEGQLEEVVNPDLLPSEPLQFRELPYTDIKVEPSIISPEGNGERDAAVITLTPPGGTFPPAVEIIKGSEVLRTVGLEGDRYVWDGRDEEGAVVPEGAYRVRIPALALEKGVYAPATEVAVAVNTIVPGTSRQWYLAEGYTGGNEMAGDFETWILVQNPGDDRANLRVVLMLADGGTLERSLEAPPASRVTLSVDSVLPDAECSAKVESDRPVVVERAVYFNGRRSGHAALGADSPSKRWYLAEGYTGGDFDEWILIQNPGDAVCFLTLELMPQEGLPVSRFYTLPPRSRRTVHVDDILPDAQVSARVTSSWPVVVERAQYLRNHLAGTCTMAARNSSGTWHFSEGYCGEGFETWLLVMNPGAEEAAVNCVFMLPDGESLTREYRVKPRSRFTVPVHEMLPGKETAITLSSERPVVAERAMYWGERVEGHATLGTPVPGTHWRFAEGYTAEGFETWLLVSNPGDEESSLQIDFLFPDGSAATHKATVPSKARYTLNVGRVVGEREVGISLKASRPVVAERAMYFYERSGGTCTIGAVE